MARPLVWLTSVFALAAGVAPAQTPDFAAATYPSPAGARGAVVADLNRDGWPDVATANTGRNTVAILLNRGDGTGLAAAREIAVGAGPFDIAAGDLNRDGIPDLIVTTPDAHAIEVLLIGADGRVASRRVVAAGSESRGATLADVTRDGRLDLVYTDYARSRVVVLPGNGLGGFGAALGEFAVGAQPQGVATGDFNHDGAVDIAIAATGASALDVLYGSATGTFTRRTVAAGRTLNVLIATDVNADGWEDLAAVATSSDAVAIFRGSASGFALAGTRTVGASPRGIAAGDFNQDGRADLAVGNFASNSVSILLARRDGSALPDQAGELASGAGARAIVAGDFDNDGRIDIVVGAQSAAQLWHHRNTTAFVTPALSLRRGSTGFFLPPGAVADFNENGQPDMLADRSIFLDSSSVVRLDVDPQASVIAVGAADYTRDGHQDALIAKVIYDAQGRQVNASLDLYRGNGHGQFTFVKSVDNMPQGLSDFRTGDLDRDGNLDVVAFGFRDLYIKRGIGSGPFAETVVPVPSGILGLALADLTRDGILDAVVAQVDSYTFAVYPGDGHGGFGAPVVAATNVAGDHFALGDMNHDGRLDIVLDRGSDVVVILATAAGGWASPVEYPSTIPWDTASGTILGDFNNDGDLDVLSWGGTMLFGNGDGTLGRPFEFAIEPRGGLAIDWNGDGLLDIIGGGQVFFNERRAQNRPPLANAGADRTFLYHEQYDQDADEGPLWGGQSTDPDLHGLSYEWRDETGMVFGASAQVTFPPKPLGTYTFTLTVRDGRGGQSTDSIRIIIAPDPELALHAGGNGIYTGNWTLVGDDTAASGYRLSYPNSGAPKVDRPAANPSNYIDVTFAPDPTQTYKLWARLKAENNYWGNDSIWLQFTGAVDAGGAPAYAIGTTSGLPINLEECSGCGLSEWGWEDDGWGAPNTNGVLLRFPAGGRQRIRIQVREDGVSIDQIVLSAVKYRTARPGRAKDDTLILTPR
jgi:hypothetical protein